MKKTAWFDKQFYFGLKEGMLPFFLERLQGTVLRLEWKLKNISEEILSFKPEGSWSIKQNIGHLFEVDEIGIKRLSEIQERIATMSPAVFEPKQDYNSLKLKEVIAEFDQSRKALLKKFQQLNENELAFTSLHPRLKVQMNPVDLAFFEAEHDDHHLVRINEIITLLNR